MSVLLTRRAVVRAEVESVSGVAQTLDLNDGVLVSDPTFSITPNVLTRDFVSDTLSTQPSIIGRRLAQMEFTTELRGNGKQQAGTLGTECVLARLFRACGFSMTAQAAGSAIGPFDIGDQANKVAWVASGTLTPTETLVYYIACTLGGASGTAKVTITSEVETPGEASAEQVITTGTLLTVGTKGLKLTPTFTGNLVAGQRWVVWLTAAGFILQPVSTNFESITLEMNKDGVKHLMPGSFGTFEITAEAGQFASIKWTFTGAWNNPVDAAAVTPTYEKTLPAQVELARLQLDNFRAVVDKFTCTWANDIQVRPDVSSTEGYIGTRITARKPVGGVDPEADLVANYDFWGRFGAATLMPFQMRIGKNVGNVVWLIAPNVQYTGLTYADRNGIMTYQAGLSFNAYSGDDELFIVMN